MTEQGNGNGEVVVTGDDDVVVNAGKEAGVVDVKTRKRRGKKIPIARWVHQYLGQPGLTPEQIQARKDQLKADYGIEA